MGTGLRRMRGKYYLINSSHSQNTTRRWNQNLCCTFGCFIIMINTFTCCNCYWIRISNKHWRKALSTDCCRFWCPLPPLCCFVKILPLPSQTSNGKPAVWKQGHFLVLERNSLVAGFIAVFTSSQQAHQLQNVTFVLDWREKYMHTGTVICMSMLHSLQH